MTNSYADWSLALGRLVMRYSNSHCTTVLMATENWPGYVSLVMYV